MQRRQLHAQLCMCIIIDHGLQLYAKTPLAVRNTDEQLRRLAAIRRQRNMGRLGGGAASSPPAAARLRIRGGRPCNDSDDDAAPISEPASDRALEHA